MPLLGRRTASSAIQPGGPARCAFVSMQPGGDAAERPGLVVVSLGPALNLREGHLGVSRVIGIGSPRSYARSSRTRLP